MGRLFCLTSLLALFLISYARPGYAAQRYRKSDIADARFGVDDKAKLLAMSYQLGDELKNTVYGQDNAVELLQNKLIQYFESFPRTSGEPPAANLVGLPGIGKSAMVLKLMEMGFPVVHMDVQRFMANKGDNFAVVLSSRLRDYITQKKPVILVLEEIDKMPEITQDGEETNAVIGTLNQILSDGKLSNGYETLPCSNVLVITTMNIAPEYIDAFSQEVLGQKKNFFDFTLEDFGKLDAWLRDQTSATYKILSKQFRNNTVTRLAPDTIVLSPLGMETYKRIVRKMAEGAVKDLTQNSMANKRVVVTIDNRLIDFITNESIFAPSGARETVKKSRSLFEQLINFGMKANGPDATSIDRPRSLLLTYDKEKDKTVIVVTPQKLVQGKLVNESPFSLDVDYNQATRLYSIPNELAKSKPSYPKKESRAKISGKMILDTRFPKAQQSIPGLREYLNDHIYGQEEAINLVVEDAEKLMGRSTTIKGEPLFRIFSGFPGIGKSELVKQTADFLKLPIIKVNMQQFSSDSPDSVRDFFRHVSSQISAKSNEIKDGRYILLIEEMDKLFEIDPMTGKLVNRPLMATLKDLMNDGKASYQDEYMTYHLDIGNALTYFTMNFSIDRFGFSADPRLTSIGDVMEAWRNLKSTPMSVKKLLATTFLPETVSRMMPRFFIMRPLEEKNYKMIIDQQANWVAQERFEDAKGIDRGQVQLELTPEYKKYLYQETVIPSEGARNTAVSARELIATDVEDALAQIPKSSIYANKPIILTLHFRPGRTQVVVHVRLQSEAPQAAKAILEKVVELKFPSLEKRGRIPADRLRVAAHEFGHAFADVRLGMRFENVVVVSPTPGIGGYVKNASKPFYAPELMAQVYGLLASRALERMVLSENPLDANSALMLTAGPSNDIVRATMTLYEMLYELGMDPHGGTLDRNFINGGVKYASYQELPPELAQQLGLALRDMENQILRDFLAVHSMDWYVDKIAKLARQGSMREKEFYQLVGYRYPGDQTESQIRALSDSTLQKLFKDYVVKPNAKRNHVLQDDYARNVMTEFVRILKDRLHPEQVQTPSCMALFAVGTLPAKTTTLRGSL